MRIDTKRKLIDTIPAERKASYHIDPSAVVHITRILRNMYEDPVKAVVREYLANAVDAHRQAGKMHTPIDVDLPSRIKSVFRVRDYGGGLGVADVEKLLLGYGASGEHKRTSDDQIGGFGIGCKCAFAISDSFTYVSWHNGMKQTWLCQLDDHDMGEAKMISHVKSDEPAGLMVEIPVSNSQVAQFESPISLVPLFFDVPIKVNDTVIKPRQGLKSELSAEMTGEFAGAKWTFYSRAGHDISNRNATCIIVVMGGMWYPVDTNQCINDESSSRLMQILRRGTNSDVSLFCAVEAPIGMFSLAPTRESLQYDNSTRRTLKRVINEIEQNLTAIAQKEIDAQDDVWLASAKAIHLQDALMYKTGITQHVPTAAATGTTAGTKAVPQSQPTFVWRGTTYAFNEALGIKAQPDNTGATAFFVTRDVRSSSSSRGRYLNLSAGQLKVHSIVLNDVGHMYAPDTRRSSTVAGGASQIYMPPSSIRVTHNLETAIANESRSRSYSYGGYRYYNHVNNNSDKDDVIVPLARVDVDDVGRVHEYVFMQEVPVFTIEPKKNAVFYARRYLISTDKYTPHRDAFAIIVQGTKEEQDAFFSLYPWLNKNAQPLPIINVMPATSASGTQPQAKKRHESVENVFKYNGSMKTATPSNNWDALSELPDGNGNEFVYLERFIPSDRPPLNGLIGSSGLSPAQQYSWLKANMRMNSLLSPADSNNQVYGFRYTKAKPNPPDGMTPLNVALDRKLNDWFDPSTLGKHEVHGLSVLLRFCPEGLTTVMGVGGSCDLLALAATNNSRYWRNGTTREQIIQAIREPEIYAHIVKTCDKNGAFAQMCLMYYNLTRLGKPNARKMDEYDGALREFARTSRHTSKFLDDTKALCANFKAYVAPMNEKLKLAWSTYPVLDLLDTVPLHLRGFKGILEYINIVDKNNAQGAKP